MSNTVQRIGSERALKEARQALNKALGMKTMSPDLMTRATASLNAVNSALTRRDIPAELDRL